MDGDAGPTSAGSGKQIALSKPDEVSFEDIRDAVRRATGFKADVFTQKDDTGAKPGERGCLESYHEKSSIRQSWK